MAKGKKQGIEGEGTKEKTISQTECLRAILEGKANSDKERRIQEWAKKEMGGRDYGTPSLSILQASERLICHSRLSPKSKMELVNLYGKD